MATSSKDMQLRGLDQLVQAQRRFKGNHAVVTAMQDQRFMPDRPDVLIGAGQRIHPSLPRGGEHGRSEEHTSELQSLMRISYAVFCLKKKNNIKKQNKNIEQRYSQNKTKTRTTPKTQTP